MRLFPKEGVTQSCLGCDTRSNSVEFREDNSIAYLGDRQWPICGQASALSFPEESGSSSAIFQK